MRFNFLLLFLFFHLLCQSQGIYTQFGQNRVQFPETEYSLKQDNIEIIYYKDGEQLAKNVLSQASAILPEFENKLNYNLSNGITIVVFNHVIDYLNSNLNLTNPQHYAGGYSSLNENTTSVYFNGNTAEFNKQIKKGIAEVMIYEFIYSGNIRERLHTAALLSLPNWYFKGLTSYLSESWNIEKDNYLKDFFISGKAKNFTDLDEDDEILAGHSIWRFLEEKYGEGTVNNIVFLTRVGSSVENAFNYYTGKTISNLLYDWNSFYIEKYAEDEQLFKLPKGQENEIKKISNKKNTQFKLNNDGTKIAIVTNTYGRYKIYIYNIKTKKIKKVLTGGHQVLNKQVNYDFPIIAWHPTSGYLTVITYKNKLSYLTSYDSEGKKIKTELLKDVPLIKEYNFHPNGTDIILSVINKGYSDLIEYDLITKQHEYITKDHFDELNPRYSIDGSSIYFSSNRTEEISSTFQNFGIFKYNKLDKSIEFIIGENYTVNYTYPIEIKKGFLTFLSDQNGIINQFSYNSVRDEAVQLTNYKRCIVYNDISFNGNVVADLILYRNKYRIYTSEISDNFIEDEAINLRNTKYRKWLNDYIGVSNEKDTTEIKNDTTNKIVAIEKKDTTKKEKIFITGYEYYDDISLDKSNSEEKKILAVSKPLELNFGINYLLQQFDNSILNNYLFPANVSEQVFNYPTINTVFQTSISDQLKNHQFEAGLRIPISIKASDYYLTYMNRRGRWDKSISMFRRGRTIDDEKINYRMINSQVKFEMIYPFNERSSIRFNLLGREDRNITLASDSVTIKTDVARSLYFGTGVEYVYDNIRSKGLNLFQGIRYKLYNENYFSEKNKRTSILGLDARFYQKLHRKIYFAGRFNTAFSFGNEKVAYYLGGVENEIIRARSVKNFSYSIPTLTGNDYAFQTIVAPMRGFLRNSRGGHNFAVMNAELRVPIVQYLFRKPITSEFLKSIMFIGFADVGAAWIGNSPYDSRNPFNTRIITTPSYTITVNTQRDPFLYGFGFGARAKLFGHYVKLDHGWGLLENKFQKPMTNFSLGLDF